MTYTVKLQVIDAQGFVREFEHGVDIVPCVHAGGFKTVVRESYTYGDHPDTLAVRVANDAWEATR